MSSFSSRPVFPLLSDDGPVVEGCYAPLHLGAREGADAVRSAITQRVLAPADVQEASEIEEPRLLWLPFWRVALTVDGFDVTVGSVGIGRDPVHIPLPWMRSRHKEAVLMVAGCSSFDYKARVPSWLGRSLSSAPPLEVDMETVAPRAGASLEGEVVAVDVGREHAVRHAKRLLEAAVRSSNAMFSRYEAQLRSADLVHYPAYFGRYRYRGQARASSVEDCWVAVSGRTGKTIAARHPSGFRSTVNRLRRLLTPQ